jgi:LysM repeat protein
VIDSYRKRQQKAQRAPLVFGLAAILVIVGVGALLFWLLGGNGPKISLFATDTPTVTLTFTPTTTPTSTNTPTLAPTETQTPTVTITPTVAGPFEYVVLEGESCWVIAVKFTVDPLLLIQINNLDPTCPIQTGQRLIIPGPDTSLPSPTPIPDNLPRGTIIEYTVQTGDQLSLIAAQFNSTVDAIKEENNIANENEILIGMKLRIPVNLVTPVPTNTVAPTSSTPLVPTATNTPQP